VEGFYPLSLERAISIIQKGRKELHERGRGSLEMGGGEPRCRQGEQNELVPSSKPAPSLEERAFELGKIEGAAKHESDRKVLRLDRNGPWTAPLSMGTLVSVPLLHCSMKAPIAKKEKRGQDWENLAD